MPVNLHAKKQLVSRIVGVGVNRVRFDSDHLDDVADAITRDDIRSLITANTITIKPFKGTSRGRAKTKKWLLKFKDIKSIFQSRQSDTHKGNYGHVLILAGSKGKTGAAAVGCGCWVFNVPVSCFVFY